MITRYPFTSLPIPYHDASIERYPNWRRMLAYPFDLHFYGKPICGVYMIYNDVADRAYVGASKNISERWIGHCSQLKNDYYMYSPVMRADYKQHGPGSFRFVILDTYEQRYLDQWERYWYFEIRCEYNSPIFIPYHSL